MKLLMRTKRSRALIVVVAVSIPCTLVGCGDSTPSKPDSELVDESELRAETDLSAGCFSWPDQVFTPSNNAGTAQFGATAGEAAIDFTLKQPDGTKHSLSELLETKPVLMVFGSFT
jgi:hypothetical protein